MLAQVFCTRPGKPKNTKELLKDDSFYAHFSLPFRPKIQRIFNIYKEKEFRRIFQLFKKKIAKIRRTGVIAEVKTAV